MGSKRMNIYTKKILLTIAFIIQSNVIIISNTSMGEKLVMILSGNNEYIYQKIIVYNKTTLMFWCIVLIKTDNTPY